MFQSLKRDKHSFNKKSNTKILNIETNLSANNIGGGACHLGADFKRLAILKIKNERIRVCGMEYFGMKFKDLW